MKEIQNIWAVGRNYANHAKELGHAVPVDESAPMIFLKAGSTICKDVIHFPDFARNVHFECEIALQFGVDLQFSQIAVALDLTERDLQNQLKKDQHPWTLAKSFKNSCPLGPLVALPRGTDLQDLNFQLKVNGVVRQEGHSRNMIHSIEKMRDYVIERFPVVAGDLLLTGTPAGVAQLKSGDVCEAQIKGFSQARWTVA